MLERERPEPPFEMHPCGFHVIDETVIHQLAENERGCSCTEQISAVGAAMIAGRNRLGHTFGDKRRANRYSSAERLAD